MVVLIRVDIEETDDTLARDGSHEALANPDCIQKVWVASHSELHFAVRHKLLSQVQFELNEEQVGGDHNHTVLFLVEENVFDRAWDLADFRAVLEVVS